jgi:hypothetical protein
MYFPEATTYRATGTRFGLAHAQIHCDIDDDDDDDDDNNNNKLQAET